MDLFGFVSKKRPQMRFAVLALGVSLVAPVIPPGSSVATPQLRLEAGEPAPDFELSGTDGKSYRLSDYRGKRAVVIAWFARAFSAG